MPTQHIAYASTGYFSKTVCDYLSQQKTLKDFYGNFPALENFENQINQKAKSFKDLSRETLVKQLKLQYKGISTSEATEKNIESLSNNNTFTITTGHQLNLFTGPLYFLYKIISVINLSEELCKAHPDNHFVPVYWMATEDHDFDEINYFNFQGKKVVWDRETGGAVGELSTEGLQQVFIAFENELKRNFGFSDHAKQLLKLFKKAYLDHGTLTEATRYLGNQLFKDYGLVIVDGNDRELKRAFIPYAEKELTAQLSFHKVSETTKALIEAGYGEQVHPREINLFYLKDGIRERIVAAEGRYLINDTELTFTKTEILAEVQEYPERFSPNALLRPLYQEVVLPNLCYTGGGGELAYWFQLKDYFESVAVPFPILLLRNSAVLVSEKAEQTLERLDVNVEDLFKKQHALQAMYTKKISNIEIDFSQQRTHLKDQFKSMYEIATKTDASFLGAVGAQEKKQLKGLDHLEKRLLKAQKRKHEELVIKVTALQDSLFPQHSLQERNTNFAEFYLEYGPELINKLKKELRPLGLRFSVIEL
jgi:bacillithiol biosynthesis cysteine-adding enzyme BshC